jgi:Undecaprenyl-phosphate galactose phosphotransferase WbaP
MSTQLIASPLTPTVAPTVAPPHPKLLPHTRFCERKWVGLVLAFGDVVALQAAFIMAVLLRKALQHWYPGHLGPVQLRGIALGLLFLPLAYLLAGLYPGYGLNPVERFRIRTKTSLTVFATLIVWDYLILNGSWSRGVLLFSAILALVLPVAMETALIRRLTRLGKWGTPVVILGSGANGAAVMERLRKQTETGLVPAVILGEGEWFQAGRREFAGRIRIAVLAIPNLGRDQLAAMLEALPFPRVIVVPGFSGLQSQWITAVDLGGSMGLELKRNLLRPGDQNVKRGVDVALGMPLLALSAPVIGLFALWIKLVSPGPAFYRQEREGFCGKSISVWKLRTMHRNAEQLLKECVNSNPERAREWASSCKLRDDPRILPGIGRLLRRSSLDELPQLWNVLCGDMSLVGPRPFPAYHLEHFEADFCRLRRHVRPGMTGLWQVSGRSDGDLGIQESLDTYYIRNWSLWMDLHVLASTMRAVVQGRGAY